MSCIVLVGGGIGCGKSTIISYILNNKSDLFRTFYTIDPGIQTDCDERNREPCVNCYVIQFDSMCSIEEQKILMKSLRGLRYFRADLLMAAERFITLFCNSETGIAGPLTERSYNLLAKLNILNACQSKKSSNTVIFVEDNFYYRSMRYDWLQIARRTNLGFATLFLHCPLNIAIERNLMRGYQIPEDRIKKMLSLMELPDPAKFKWEKISVIFDTSPCLSDLPLSEVFNAIKEALKNPVELIISEEKIEAQKICSKNVVHQSDKILRKIVSKLISNLKAVYTSEDNTLKTLITTLLDTRQRLLCDIKQGTVHLPEDLVEKIQNLGIESVLNEYEEKLQQLFVITLMTLEEPKLDLSAHLNNLQIEE